MVRPLRVQADPRNHFGAVGFPDLLRLCYSITPVTVLGLVAGTASVIGSGSRGGAVMAVAAVGCVLIARRSPALAGIMAYLPAEILVLGGTGLAFLLASGLAYFPLLGDRISLTDRTVIWQYALDAWTDRPLLGFGIQGFWTDPTYYDHFVRSHGWILDNYHSGYLSLLVEQGLLGALVFIGFVLILCHRLRKAVQRAPALASLERFGREAAFGFLILSFTINLTETFFFRATDFSQVSVAFVTIFLFSRSHWLAEPVSRRGSIRPGNVARVAGGWAALSPRRRKAGMTEPARV